MSRVKELAKQFGKTETEIKQILRPMLTALFEFCESDGGEEALRAFRSSAGGQQFLAAIRDNPQWAVKPAACNGHSDG